jgi:hypothetical protein
VLANLTARTVQFLTPSGSLIYEYIGEVVKETTFRKRMQQYAEEGIRHFYFMMLQKEEVRALIQLHRLG